MWNWVIHSCGEFNPRPDTRSLTNMATDATETLIDLAGIDIPSPPHPAVPPTEPSDPVPTDPMAFPIPVLPPPPKRLADPHGSQNSSPSHAAGSMASTALSLLDDELLSLGTCVSSL